MDKKLITKNVLLTGNSVEKKREEILDYFLKTYEIYEKLFECFKDDTVFYKQPEPLRHPLIFYFGHTASFYINKLVISKNIEQRLNPVYENMFAIGVDEMSWDDLNEQNYDWPTVKETREYRERVKEVVVDFIKTTPFTLPIEWESPMWIILMGIEHERIHLETSSVLHRQLGIEEMKKHPFWSECHTSGPALENELLHVPGGVVKMGKKRDDDLYGWDNEYGTYEEEIEDFKASKYLVSNGEFLEFLEDGGYKNNDYWSEEGQHWKEYRGVSHPVFWVKDGESFRYRTMAREITMPLDWPVDVNFLEAEAFCNWKSEKEGKNITLPSEAMWQRLHEHCSVKDEPFWDEAPGNINLEHYASSCPVNMFRFGDFYDVIGNVWQWTTTPIDGFEGFEVHPAYDDFSTPTFDNRHNLIKGGSWISTGNEAINKSRYAFRRHFYQHAGFRYVESKEQKNTRENFYETDEQISQYCDFHYGAEHYGVENFHKRCAEIAFKYAGKKGRALDLGCSVGRGVFELAREFESVTGIDFSARFIRIGQFLKDDGRVGYTRTTEGDRTQKAEVILKDLNLQNVNLNRVEFWQGDACNLKPHFKKYDLIISANLVDRVYDPEKFLRDMGHRLNEGGIFIIGSPFTWNEDYTAKEKWLCSSEKTGQERVEEILQEEFEGVAEPFEEEFVIRETERKFQHSKSLFSVWRKKD